MYKRQGTPEVGGYTSFEGLQFIRGLKDINFVGFDIVEVAPPYDIADITSLLAANVAVSYTHLDVYKRQTLDF